MLDLFLHWKTTKHPRKNRRTKPDPPANPAPKAPHDRQAAAGPAPGKFSKDELRRSPSHLIAGVHPVREALRAGRPLDRILIARGAGGPRLQEIIDLARERSVAVRFEPRETLDRASNTATHQGIVAFGAAHRYADLDDVLPNARLLIVLDGVEDPHNLGAIIRTAQAAGASAVIVPERRASPLTDVVAKASAGALEHLPVVRVGNLNQTLEDLKKRHFWIYGVDERGSQVYTEIEYSSPSVFVFGGEGHGLHDLVKKHCDVLVRIPMAGAIASLNVSVAAGVVLFEWRRRQPK